MNSILKKCVSLLLFIFLVSNSVKAQVNIVAPSVTFNTCVFPTEYQTLNYPDNYFQIVEDPVNEIAMVKNVSYSFVITAPANFEFNPGVGSIINWGGSPDITTLSMVVTATTITVTYSTNENQPINEYDNIIINGIQVRAINGPSAGNATVTSMSQDIINGIDVGTPMADFESGPCPLPVELINFNATLNNTRKVDLTWQTASEFNNDYFIVQKSLTGNEWENLGAIDGAGNSTQELNYAYEDNKPFLGLNYYRLKQVDFDGTINYSELRAVNLNANINVSLFPNPAIDAFFLQGKEISTKEIYLTNSIGQLIQVDLIILSDEILQIDSSDLSDGFYTIQINGPTEIIKLRLIKVKN